MDNKAICDRSAPFMVRRQDTGDCAVLLLEFDTPSNPRIYKSLVSRIEDLFYPEITNEYRARAAQGKLITKLEARRLPRRGYDSEGYPHTLLL
jgi:hypothetical protein